MAEATSITRPVIVDLGKTKRKRIRKLKRGRGRLLAEIHEIVHEVEHELGSDAEGKELVPVVIIYRKKRKRGGAGFPIPMPFR